jgi:uncharacterized membrane protein YkvA (DUF1232 family)
MSGRPDDLFALVKQTISGIDALDGDVAGLDVAEFSRQLRAARPDLFEPLGDRGLTETASRALAAAMLGVVKEIPQIAEAMMGAVDRRTTEPAVRCALIGALAYLVRPRDLLPDGLPGGYGYIDDCMILRATLTEFLDYLPRGFTTAEREKRLLELLAVCVPPARLPEFQAEVEGIWLAFHVLLWKTEDEIEDIAARLQSDPLGTPLPDAARDSIPLPPGPRLSMAPGCETIGLEDGAFFLRFQNGGIVRVERTGRVIEIA